MSRAIPVAQTIRAPIRSSPRIAKKNKASAMAQQVMKGARKPPIPGRLALKEAQPRKRAD